MSRSNHHYYNICGGPVNADGYCKFHEPAEYSKPQKTCLPERQLLTRRGVYHRRKRFPAWSLKEGHRGPSMEIKQIWRRLVRARQAQELIKRPDDPLITPFRRLINHSDWWY